jgi:hypothetical protein
MATRSRRWPIASLSAGLALVTTAALHRRLLGTPAYVSSPLVHAEAAFMVLLAMILLAQPVIAVVHAVRKQWSLLPGVAITAVICVVAWVVALVVDASTLLFATLGPSESLFAKRHSETMADGLDRPGQPLGPAEEDVHGLGRMRGLDLPELGVPVGVTHVRLRLQPGDEIGAALGVEQLARDLEPCRREPRVPARHVNVQVEPLGVLLRFEAGQQCSESAPAARGDRRRPSRARRTRCGDHRWCRPRRRSA